jgi:cobaltochelatase CobN
MHLFAAQPGGFNDDEGIVDLQQTPADVVILSAADSTLAALANTAESLPDDYPGLCLANWMNLTKPAALDLYRDKTLDHAKLVIVSVLGGENYWPYGIEQLVEWASGGTKHQPRSLILMPGDDALDEALMRQSTVPFEVVMRLWRYLREGTSVNYQAFFHCIEQALFKSESNYTPSFLNEIPPPRQLPPCLLYKPAFLDQINLDQTNTLDVVTLKDWQVHWDQRSTSSDEPVAILLFYRSHLQSANTAMFDQLLQVLMRQGIRPLPVAVASLKDVESLALVNDLIEQSHASVIINTTGFASNRAESPDLSSQPTEFESPFNADLPVLQLVLSSSTEEDWQAYSQGLRSRDIAMQVVLPEMDGRVITRAVSFKSEAWYSERCQISVVGYQLHRERAEFIAKLAKSYGQLARLPNQQKRIAVILANYPTKDGRIGNGVGLDTPASTIHILNALEAAGYPIEDIPESGNALIEALLGAVTNNPNTLHLLPCWQSMSAEDYWQYFCELPETAQTAVLERWGTPDQDPKFRNGRMMLAGIRLGETFVGIQPARGYNLDLAANYHDPDLIPPHSYLAFYFWLRHCYQVNAVVHVGKHGNLEWLPGKGSALSDQCWPDIALGPMPHFYPFIVNDPGEGSQAKRRTQAVIIDHLMPPMTRAETYGELAELEGLVDEYYQALGLDTRREDWLKEEILKAVKDSNLLQEIALKDQLNADEDPLLEDDQLLEQLDAYLCEIKEAQIRHGLHILGELPNTDKLADTLVALLRLPRGQSPESQGVLHNLADDLNLKSNDERFDPMSATTAIWQGEKPECLLEVSDQCWRSEQDTRERLELYAKQLVNRYVLDAADITPLLETLPRTCIQLNYARDVLLAALDKSVEQEISSLISGLSGCFVKPGPSGAPTRGRLDTLPTGRNFFSVDNRSIPSPAAWAIGQTSAQALIERHLQEHGDYPKQLGLSVWGTATMRTGGDDIAQAFALMGVKPIWAEGSHRVIDFEIVPGMLLQRPRVDVTLRVSGFFRDAFPNVMRIYDAAVQALAEYQEPGTDNVIRHNIEQQQQVLIAQGMSPSEAKRQSSYRVFGSKPGAYGAGLQGLIDERCWETRDDLAEAYLNWGGYAYGSGDQERDGVEAKGAFQHRLSQLEAVVQNQDNREHDLLDSDDYYQFQGGMTNAVSRFSGVEPVVYHNDHSNPVAPKIRTLKEELNRVIRSRVLNPKWIEAMREHGYKGAFEMSASVDYMFAYDATTNLIDDYQYQYVADALVFDDENRQFMKENNPHALEEMAERLLEATQRGLWQEPGEYADKLQDLLLDIDQQQEGA